MAYFRRLMGIAVCAGFLLISGMVFAQSYGGNSEGKFNALDRNRDGRISEDEFVATAREHAEKLFNTIDVQRHGYITRDDIQAARNRVMEKRGRQAPSGGPWRHIEENFNTIDANRDGRITLDEWIADATARAQKTFKRLDANGDGYISKEEYEAVQERAIQRKSQRSQRMDPMNQ